MHAHPVESIKKKVVVISWLQVLVGSDGVVGVKLMV